MKKLMVAALALSVALSASARLVNRFARTRVLAAQSLKVVPPDAPAEAEAAPRSAPGMMERALAPFVESGELPGAISVLSRPGVEEVALLGFADVAKGRRITLDDPFMQCSQTKGFCGVTVAILVEEGKVSLDDPVSKYLPEFREMWIRKSDRDGVRELVRAKNPVTIRTALNHTSGFEFEIPAKQHEIRGGGWTGGMPIRSVAATAASLPLRFEPGTGDQYSNTGIDVAAAVVEVVTGKPWPEFLRERVLAPLGMNQTVFKPTDAMIARKIEMYRIGRGRKAEWMEENPWEQRPYNGDHVFPSAGAGLWTTTRDQLKFYRMLMNYGVGDNGVRILKEETVKNLLLTSSRPAGMNRYSLGLSVEGGGWVGHTGAFGTGCFINPEKKFLKLWVVQKDGSADWEGRLRTAVEDRFFADAPPAQDAK